MKATVLILAALIYLTTCMAYERGEDYTSNLLAPDDPLVRELLLISQEHAEWKSGNADRENINNYVGWETKSNPDCPESLSSGDIVAVLGLEELENLYGNRWGSVHVDGNDCKGYYVQVTFHTPGEGPEGGYNEEKRIRWLNGLEGDRRSNEEFLRDTAINFTNIFEKGFWDSRINLIRLTQDRNFIDERGNFGNMDVIQITMGRTTAENIEEWEVFKQMVEADYNALFDAAHDYYVMPILDTLRRNISDTIRII